MYDVAEHLGVSVPYVSDVENGKRAPFTPDKTMKFAELCGIDPTVMLRLAAQARGSFEFDARTASPKRQEFMAALMRGYNELTDEDAEKLQEQLARITRRPQEP